MSIVVRGIVVALDMGDSGHKAFVRVRLTTADAQQLARAGAFGQMLRIELPPEGARELQPPADPNLIVVNEEPAAGGDDEEKDPALRARARDFFRQWHHDDDESAR